MTRDGQSIMTKLLWAVLVVAVLGVLTAGYLRDRSRRNPLPPTDPVPVANVSASPAALAVAVPDFSLIDQDEKTVSLSSLRGRVWVADFVFTNCGGPCPLMTARMARLQTQINNPNVMLISFSVDSKRDTPAVLKAYAKRFNADESSWRFLTGDGAAIQTVARGMLASVQPATADAPIIHSERFMLIDSTGTLRLAAHSSDEAAMDHLVEQAKTLAAKTSKATP